MPRKILLVEDSDHKRSRVVEVLRLAYLDAEITEANSFTSGCQAIGHKQFDVVILDISLPTYDRIGNQTGGRFRTFGGREIARKIIRRGLSTKIVFLTQYVAFSDRKQSFSFDSLKRVLADDCQKAFLGMIHYDSSEFAWKNDLLSLVEMTG